MNQNPEQLARDRIDQQLVTAGWVVHNKIRINLRSTSNLPGAVVGAMSVYGVAVREYPTDVCPADYVLFVDTQPVGVIEANREEEGHRLTPHEDQSGDYAKVKLRLLNNDPLPFVYASTGTVTRFTDYLDPKPRSREFFSFH